jgi:hypothetical protein
MQRYRNKLVYDTTTGELRDEKRHMSMLEDFWMPRREGGKGTEVQTLPGGQNLGELQDVDYFLKKLYTALHVPPSRFKEDSGFNMGKSAEISRDEVRFTKFVNRLQSKFCEIFLQLLRVQLLSKNILTEDEWKEYSYDFNFDFAKDAYFSELKENEMTMTRLLTMREIEPYLGRFFSKRWVNKNILQMSDDEIELMESEMEKEAAETPMQPDMGMMGGFPPQQNEFPPAAIPSPSTEPIAQELDVEGTADELGLEIPDVEAYGGEEGATGEMSDEEVDEMIASFENFFPSSPIEGNGKELILENKTYTHAPVAMGKTPSFSSRVLSSILAKKSINQDLHT